MSFKLLLKKIFDWSLNHFFKTFIILALFNLLIFIFLGHISWLLNLSVFILLTTYLVLFVITRIKYHIIRLLNHELKIKDILSGYIVSVLFTILLFGIIYAGLNISGVGYLRYASCIDVVKVDKLLIDSDPYAVNNFFHELYFSAIAFFTVGYGDICPMGASKFVSVFNALIGNIFTVIILAIAVTNYSSHKKIKTESKKIKKSAVIKNSYNVSDSDKSKDNTKDTKIKKTTKGI
ncbi:MAG: ion channel [Candidatus Woesearchaeota archaeon]